SPDSAGPDSTGPGNTVTNPANQDADGAYPVEIETQFGTTVIESRPERIVSIGFTDGDFILALGVTPVAIREWYGDQPGGLWPWAAETAAAKAGSIEKLSSDAISVEKIAALKPDLIVGIVSGMTKAEYDDLSQIAPTIAQTDQYVEWGTPWNEIQLTIGKALGLHDEAEAIVASTRALIDEAAQAHPEWTGKTAQFGVVGPDGTWYSYGEQDNRGRLLTELGFVVVRMDGMGTNW
ncbi:MAG TPA: ABC transporter substrate-binding protein, partial [Ilumatobacteraceae bacterium]|nr:ABC transporter substrate-binding protein [Ilumatobacteraceae bacterium]